MDKNGCGNYLFSGYDFNHSMSKYQSKRISFINSYKLEIMKATSFRKFKSKLFNLEFDIQQ